MTNESNHSKTFLFDVYAMTSDFVQIEQEPHSFPDRRYLLPLRDSLPTGESGEWHCGLVA